jgi:hypothetical protein
MASKMNAMGTAMRTNAARITIFLVVMAVLEQTAALRHQGLTHAGREGRPWAQL